MFAIKHVEGMFGKQPLASPNHLTHKSRSRQAHSSKARSKPRAFIFSTQNKLQNFWNTQSKLGGFLKTFNKQEVVEQRC